MLAESGHITQETNNYDFKLFSYTVNNTYNFSLLFKGNKISKKKKLWRNFLIFYNIFKKPLFKMQELSGKVVNLEYGINLCSHQVCSHHSHFFFSFFNFLGCIVKSSLEL